MWNKYNLATQFRPVRKLLLQALETIQSKEKLRAIELGFGCGAEVIHLLEKNWNVTGYDGNSDAAEQLQLRLSGVSTERFNLVCKNFEEIDSFPKCDLFFSSFSLPFCDQTKFSSLLDLSIESILPGGVLAINLFGPEDEWVQFGKCQGLTKSEVLERLKNFKVLDFHEKNEVDRTALGPEKHWHVYSIIAVKETA